MDDDQQFCLRWNNHQSTLVAVFDTLLENGTLVDCTLAAEGKYLNAHKVVLSACSPYFEALLSKHFDKHPIVVLKDVKFQELKAMMDYMYRGEVNISQDQLGALLKAAESLQIKGLSDNKRGETERKPVPIPVAPKSPPPAQTALPKVQGLTIEQRGGSREGSTSPGPRKKKRLRRKSEELDNHDASNSSESHSLPAQTAQSLPALPMKMSAAEVPEPVESKSEILTRHKQQLDDLPQVPILKEKIETHTELMLEPKSEYVDEMNEDSIEDLTLDDDDLSNMEQMDDQAGPSHGNAGEGSSQGFGGWHMGNQSQDEVFLAAQEAVGAHRDSQGTFESARKRAYSSDYSSSQEQMVGKGRRKKRNINKHDSSSEDYSEEITPPPTPKSIPQPTFQPTPNNVLVIATGDLPQLVKNDCEATTAASTVFNLTDIDEEGVDTIQEMLVVHEDQNATDLAYPSLENVHTLLVRLTTICCSIERYVKELTNNNQAIRLVEGNTTIENSMKDLRQRLPFKTREELSNFDKELKNCPRLQKTFVTYIKSIGGKDVKDNGNKCLAAIITNELGVQCSWYGQRGNIRIADSTSMNIIVDILVSQYSGSKVTICDVQKNLNEWFRLSKQRLQRKKN